MGKNRRTRVVVGVVLGVLAAALPLAADVVAPKRLASASGATLTLPVGSGLHGFVDSPDGRIIDTRAATRTGTCNATLCNRLSANATTTFQVTGAGGVPTGATAAVVSVIALAPTGNGTLRISPSGAASAGTVNLEAATSTSAVITAPLDANGRFTVTASTAVDVVVDVAGWYVAPDPGDSGNTLTTLAAPTRVADTRPATRTGTCNNGTCTTLPANTTTHVAIAGQGTVPAEINAAVLNVTVTNPPAAGYLGIGAGTNAAAGFLIYDPTSTSLSVVAPIADDGTVDIHTTNSVDITIDVVGTFARPTDTWTYQYGIDGLRSAKHQPATGLAPTQATWSDGPIPLLLAQHTGTSTSYLIYGPGNQPIYQVRADGSVLYLHQDHQGSTRLVTSANGNTYGTLTYDAYGRTLTDTTPWYLERPLLGYTGQQHDNETGFLYLRARYYDPTTGQFLTRDPLHTSTRTPYSYANGNPTELSDPSGLCPICIVVGLGFVAGAGQDLALQMAVNLLRGCGATDDIDWNSVLLSGAINAILKVPGPALGRGLTKAGGFVDDLTPSGTSIVRYDPDFAIGQVARGGQARASDLVDFGASQGWRRTQTAGGPIKFVDDNGITRLTIKSGSPRAPGSGAPHIEIRNAAGQRIDVYGNPVTRRSPGNHTPIIWDLGP